MRVNADHVLFFRARKNHFAGPGAVDATAAAEAAALASHLGLEGAEVS